MSRPIPTTPHGPRKLVDPAPALTLSIPRISPEWQLAAQLALVKPKPYTKDKIAHRNPEQPWPRNARPIIIESLNGAVFINFPSRGPHRVRATFPHSALTRVRRLARKLSRLLPDLWFTLNDDTYIRDGVLYIRSGKYKLELVRASKTRLRRAVRFGFLGDVAHARTRTAHRTRQNQPAQPNR